MDDDLKKRLLEAGIPVGSWTRTKSGNTTPDILIRQKKQLEELRDLLQDRVSRDISTVAMLRERLNRIKFGGGA